MEEEGTEEIGQIKPGYDSMLEIGKAMTSKDELEEAGLDDVGDEGSEGKKKTSDEKKGDEDIEGKKKLKSDDENKKKQETKKNVKKERPAEHELVTSDGETIKIPLNAKLKKKVNDEEKEFTVQEVLDRFAFEEGYTKKLHTHAEDKKKFEADQTKLKQELSEFQNQRQTVATQLTQAKQAFVSGNVDDFVSSFAYLVGLNPVEAASHLRRSYLPKMQEYMEADEDKRKTLDLAETNEYLKKQNELYGGLSALQQKMTQAEQSARYALQQSGLTETEWASAKKAVNDKYLGGKDFVLERAQPHEIQQYVEAICLQGQVLKKDTKVGSLIDKVDEKLRTENKEEYDHIAKILSPHIDDMTEEDLVDVVKKYLGKDAGDDEELDEDEAVEIDDDKPKKKARRKLASDSEEDFDEYLREVEKEADDDPLGVYDRYTR